MNLEIVGSIPRWATMTNKKYTQEEFLEKFHLSPISLEDLAFEASYIKDNENLSEAAVSFMAAVLELEHELEKIGFEFG